MTFNKYRPIFEVLAASFLVYLAHKLFFLFNENNPKYQNFHYSIETLYEFFFVCAILIVFILIKVKEKNLDNVGYTFLLITCVKMGISYALLYPILRSGAVNVGIEKINFFIIFILFLTIETIVTIKILNNKH